jgi:hypothetical protein
VLLKPLIKQESSELHGDSSSADSPRPRVCFSRDGWKGSVETHIGLLK